jgi:S-formylglutathione hydrolase FrmB
VGISAGGVGSLRLAAHHHVGRMERGKYHPVWPMVKQWMQRLIYADFNGAFEAFTREGFGLLQQCLESVRRPHHYPHHYFHLFEELSVHF